MSMRDCIMKKAVLYATVAAVRKRTEKTEEGVGSRFKKLMRNSISVVHQKINKLKKGEV